MALSDELEALAKRHGAACAKPALILPERDKRNPVGKPATMSRGEIMVIVTWPSVGLVGVT